MKNSIYTAIFIVVSVFALSACDGFLDMNPTNSTPAEEAISTPKDAEVIMNGIMRSMTSSNYYGRRFILYGDTKGGDITINSAGRGEDGLYAFNHSANSGSYSTFWTTGYFIIMNLNNLLENIEKLEAAGGEGYTEYKGQALTLRALLYFDLVRLYGLPYNYNKTAYGVPLITKTLEYDAKPGRASVEDVYKQIIIDLEDGQQVLSENKEHKRGFIGYYANVALQARVKLFMDDYAGALTAAEEVINSGVYRLYEPEEWVDSWSKQHQSESILELFMQPNEGDLGTGSLGYYYQRRRHINTNALGYFIASDYFLQRLGEDNDDVRWGIMSYDETSNSRYGSCYKYMGSTKLSGDGKETPSAVNLKLIRLSEIYLIAAEAALNKPDSDPTLAATYLNAIRKRAPQLPEATAATISDEMILDERSKEFFGEGLRFFDMIRKNQQIEFNDDFNDVPVSHREKVIDRTFYKIVLPISQGEINANPTLKTQQNEGYE